MRTTPTRTSGWRGHPRLRNLLTCLLGRGDGSNPGNRRSNYAGALTSVLGSGLVVAACVSGAQEADFSPLSSKSLADLSLEQLVEVQVECVSTASKYEQKVTQAPSAVSIVTAEEIKRFGHRTLADVLQSVRGFYVSNDRNFSYIGVRGFLRPGDYNTRVLLLVDGHRMNDNIYDDALNGTEGVIDVDLIDRVEVVRGPSSSIYGDSAFFGVINVITKRGGEVGGVEISGEAGSFDTYKGRFTYGKAFSNGVEMVLSGSWYQSDGERNLFYPEFNNPSANNGVAKNSDGGRAQNLFGTLSYEDLTLSGAYNWREKTVPTASFGTIFNSRLEKTWDDRGYLDLKYEHAFTEDTTLMARAAYDVYPYRGNYPLADPGVTGGTEMNKDGAFGQWVTMQAQLTQELFERNRLIFGAELRDDMEQHQFNYDQFQDGSRRSNLDDHRSGRNFAIFAQGEFALLTNLVLNAGVRYDDYASFGHTINPRVGLIYSPWEKTTFKLLYGEAFRAPNEYELHFTDAVIVGNPALNPETIRTYEAVYEQYLPAHLRLGTSAYYYQIHDLISQVPHAGGSFTFANVDHAEAGGWELELEAKYGNGALARVSYALQRARDSRTGRELNNSPRQLAKANFILPLYRDKAFAGLEVQYEGAVRTLGGNRASDFVLANLTLFSQKLVKGLEVSGSIYNLFGTRYGYPGAIEHVQDVIPQSGRTFRVKVTYRF